MNSNQFWDKNVKEFEKHLSHFGRKVLSNLLQHYRSGECTRGGNQFYKSNANPPQVFVQSCYEESDSVSGFNPNFALNNDVNSIDNELASGSSSSALEIATRIVSKTNELVKCTQDGFCSGNTDINYLDIIHSNDNEYTQMIQNNDNSNIVDSLPSDDRFYNTDKYTENSTTIASPKNSNAQVISNNTEDSWVSNKIDSNMVTMKEIVKSTKKTTKIAKSNSKDTIQKYEKGIKSWLKNVNPVHTVNNTNYFEDVDNTNYDINPENGAEFLETSNTDANNKLKKAVQTKLKNENGVMKFSKPKGSIDSNSKENSISIENAKPKAKKNKFVAPVKSQN